MLDALTALLAKVETPSPVDIRVMTLLSSLRTQLEHMQPRKARNRLHAHGRMRLESFARHDNEFIQELAQSWLK